MKKNETTATSAELWERLERVQYRLQGVAAIIEERAYGLNELGVHNEGYDMDADNLIASILREEAKAIDAFIDSESKKL